MEEQTPVELDYFQSIVVIQLSRIYDLLLLNLSQEDAKKISALHESGRYLAPEPSVAQE